MKQCFVVEVKVKLFHLIITLKIDKIEPECNKESQMHNLGIEAAWMPLISAGL